MRTSLLKATWLPLWSFALLTAVSPLHAETPSIDSMIQNLQQGLAQEQQNAQGAGDASQLPPLPSLSAPPPAPPQQPDRANKNGAAKALAMAGAAMAMVGCMKLMKDAKEAREQGKTETAAMLEAMAMQQCSQGMKDMADAMKNDDNKKQLTMNDTPKMASLQAQSLPASKSTAKEPNLMKFSPGSGEEEPTIEIPTFESPEIPSFPTGNNGPSDSWRGSVGAPQNPVTTLAPIDGGKLSFDESAKGNPAQTTSSGPGAAGLTGAAAIKPPGQEDFKSAQAIGPEGTLTKRRGVKGGDDEGSSTGGAESSEGGKKEDSFANMLNQLMGGPAAETAAFGAFNTSEFANLGNADGKPKMNIFQFASVQYQKLTYEAGRVRLRAGPVARSSVVAPEAAQAAPPDSPPTHVEASLAAAE